MAHLQVVNQVLYRPVDLASFLDESFASTCVAIRKEQLILAQLSTEVGFIVYFGIGVHKLFYRPDSFRGLSGLRVLGSIRTGALMSIFKQTAVSEVTVFEMEGEGNLQLIFEATGGRKVICHAGTGTVIL